MVAWLFNMIQVKCLAYSYFYCCLTTFGLQNTNHLTDILNTLQVYSGPTRTNTLLEMSFFWLYENNVNLFECVTLKKNIFAIAVPVNINSLNYLHFFKYYFYLNYLNLFNPVCKSLAPDQVIYSNCLIWFNWPFCCQKIKNLKPIKTTEKIRAIKWTKFLSVLAQAQLILSDLFSMIKSFEKDFIPILLNSKRTGRWNLHCPQYFVKHFPLHDHSFICNEPLHTFWR